MFKNTLKKVLILGLSFGAFSSLSADDKVIKVGATPVPHAEILEAAKPLIKAKGYTLEVVDFTDYVTPNLALEDGELDANFFQHQPYLTEFNKNKGTHLVKTVNVHIEPMGLYSKKIKSLDELKDGATIAVPNDPSNESRALDILVNKGLLTFKDVKLKTALDIDKNPKNIKIEEIDAPQLPRVLDEVDGAIINTNYALPAGLNPVKDALVIESKDSPYANIIVVKKGNENTKKTQVLDEVMNSVEIKKFIQDKYKGAIVEAF